MKNIISDSPHDSSFSFSRRYFNFRKKFFPDPLDSNRCYSDDTDDHLTLNCSSFSDCPDYPVPNSLTPFEAPKSSGKLPKAFASPYSKLLRILAHPGLASRHGSRSRGVGTLFGNRRGHVHFAFQEGPRKPPQLLVQLATPTSVLVREMASGLVRVALECDAGDKKRRKRLVEEDIWRSYCNGRRCGYALRRRCGDEEARVLGALEPVTMGAGVLPREEGEADDDGDEAGEVMYMRARFERVVGSKDSEAYYMISPDRNGAGPELSIYLIRV
ncbi:hypothetical protein MLD38_011440 [Melastoma candidum]|uniref:Uncharacterized protein n=1 Tax=Melastoma candidum TaxID=119954 RepID=A0ACB9R353_9MYRT|nr:hypothetical protein MLD38_011440 [Melastoma candidum]